MQADVAEGCPGSQIAIVVAQFRHAFQFVARRAPLLVVRKGLESGGRRRSRVGIRRFRRTCLTCRSRRSAGWRARLFEGHQIRDTLIGFLSHNWTCELATCAQSGGSALYPPTTSLKSLSENRRRKLHDWMTRSELWWDYAEWK